MWFQEVIAEFDNGQQISVIADLSENFLHATTFFSYFSDAPTFDTYDLLLDKEPQITLKQGLEDILNAISEKEETKEDFTTA